VGFEPENDFEQELRQALQRRPAPPALKRKLMQKRRAKGGQNLSFIWQRLAAAIVLVGVLAGGYAWRYQQEQRKEEAARQQVMTALRITARALNRMNARLAASGRTTQE
jgi:hypothetical protein